MLAQRTPDKPEKLKVIYFPKPSTKPN